MSLTEKIDTVELGLAQIKALGAARGQELITILANEKGIYSDKQKNAAVDAIQCIHNNSKKAILLLTKMAMGLIPYDHMAWYNVAVLKGLGQVENVEGYGPMRARTRELIAFIDNDEDVIRGAFYRFIKELTGSLGVEGMDEVAKKELVVEVENTLDTYGLQIEQLRPSRN